MSSPALCALVVLGATVAGCRPERGAPASTASTAARPPAAPATVLEYTATDYRFEGPGRVPAGRALFRLANQGSEPHHLVVLRIEQGRTYDSLLAALKVPGPAPAWIRALGGPNAVSPGGESNVEQILQPGHYAIICFVPTRDGVPHLAKGMVSPLEVTGAEAAQVAAAGPVNGVIRATDYAFELSPALTPGRHVLRVENAGPQLHEVVLARLAAGKSPEDLVRWELAGRRGTPPGTYLGGVAPLGPGERAQFEVGLEPGEYALICFVPDTKDGKPHTAHGMIKRFRVG